MKTAEVLSYVEVLGPLGFARYATHRITRSANFKRAPFKLYSRYTRFPLWCRPGTSDLTMYAEIICNRAFRCLDSVLDAHLILDCGANAGYSSAYFLSRYPQATVIAIEPDPENFKLLGRNLAPYLGRYQADQFRNLVARDWRRPFGGPPGGRE